MHMVEVYADIPGQELGYEAINIPKNLIMLKRPPHGNGQGEVLGDWDVEILTYVLAPTNFTKPDSLEMPT